MITLTRAQMDAIQAAAEAAYPGECCGLLAGIEGETGDFEVTRVVASPNLMAGQRSDRFEVDPQVHFDLLRALGDGPEKIVGHYHSHPDALAEPSATDLERAWDPGFVWLITSVRRGLARMTAAHRIDPESGRFRPLPLRLVESPSDRA